MWCRALLALALLLGSEQEGRLLLASAQSPPPGLDLYGGAEAAPCDGGWRYIRARPTEALDLEACPFTYSLKYWVAGYPDNYLPVVNGARPPRDDRTSP